MLTYWPVGRPKSDCSSLRAERRVAAARARLASGEEAPTLSGSPITRVRSDTADAMDQPDPNPNEYEESRISRAIGEERGLKIVSPDEYPTTNCEHSSDNARTSLPYVMLPTAKELTNRKKGYTKAQVMQARDYFAYGQLVRLQEL
ncbi:MAG: hypothetical protein M1816_002392 [Peltula sp. TS41687]|nr:MAG: hypothetical protein M1816_002392 [Peltula sp. TS41687]